MLNRIFSLIIICLSASFLSAQTIEPTVNFYSAKTNRRISEQVTKNSIFISGTDMITTTSISNEYEQKIGKPENNLQKISVNNLKFDGYIEMAGNKQPIKDIPASMKQVSVFTNKNGIIDSVDANPEIIQQLKQTITGRMEKGKPNPHFFSVKTLKKLGESWIDSSYYYDENNFYITHYKFEKLEDNLFVLTFTGDIKMLLNYEQNQIAFQSDVIGNISGIVHVEPNTNYIIKTEGKMKLEGRIIANTQEFPTVINGTFIDKLKK